MTLNPDLVRARCSEIEEPVRRLKQVAALLHAVRSSYTESCHPERSAVILSEGKDLSSPRGSPPEPVLSPVEADLP